MEEKLRDVGLHIAYMVAGFAGSLVAISKGAQFSFRKAFFLIVCGVASANYLTMVVVTLMNVPKGIQFGIAFLLGVLGLNGIQFFIDKIFKSNDNTQS